MIILNLCTFVVMKISTLPFQAYQQNVGSLMQLTTLKMHCKSTLEAIHVEAHQDDQVRYAKLDSESQGNIDCDI